MALSDKGVTDRRRPGRPPRSAEETARVRRQILDAAERTFARAGFHGVTATSVIAEAGLTRTNFYRYFRSADEPLHIVLERFTDDLLALIEQHIRPVPHGPERMVAGIDAYLEWSRRYRHLLPAVTADLHDPASPVSAIRQRALDAVVGIMSRDYAGSDWPMPSRTALDIFVNTLEYTCHRLYLDTDGTPEDVARARDLMLRIATAILGSGERRSYRDDRPEAQAEAG
jgi:TetR/AcrR family transcriptional regulator